MASTAAPRVSYRSGSAEDAAATATRSRDTRSAVAGRAATAARAAARGSGGGWNRLWPVAPVHSHCAARSKPPARARATASTPRKNSRASSMSVMSVSTVGPRHAAGRGGTPGCAEPPRRSRASSASTSSRSKVLPRPVAARRLVSRPRLT